MTVKQIPESGNFEANGKTYHIEDTLSIERWIFMNELTIELGFGVEFQEMQKQWLNVLELADKMQFGKIVISAHNMVNGISKVYSRKPMILKFCALFMNTEHEDRGIITEEQISIKIDDWTKEGLGIDGFFVFSLLKVKGLAENFQNVTLSGSEMLEGLLQSDVTAKNQNQ